VFSQASEIFNMRSHMRGHPERHVVRVATFPEPEISIYDHSTSETAPLRLEPLDIDVSHGSMCVGSFDGGRYSPCPHSQRVGTYSMCSDCGATMIRHLECIFEPKCEGEVCGEGICTAEHAVYIAYYGSAPKVGMSTSGRVLTRVREQGADGYTIVARVPNRYRARRLERTIFDTMDVRQAFRSEGLLPLLTRGVDGAAMSMVHEGLAAELEKELDLVPSPLQTLDYDFAPLDEVPALVGTPGRHRGDYLGAKGRFLLYDDGGPKALRLKDLEGRFLLDVV
jgi:hypothetical protein